MRGKVAPTLLPAWILGAPRRLLCCGKAASALRGGPVVIRASSPSVMRPRVAPLTERARWGAGVGIGGLPVCGARRWMGAEGGAQKRLDEVVKLGIPKKLNDLVKLELLHKEDPAKVLAIWMEYFKDKEGAVAGVMSRPEYDAFKFRTGKAVMCLLPVFRDEGHFVVIAQAQSDRELVGGSVAFLCTHLEDYRANPTLAQPYLSITVYTDMLESKDIALVRGEFDRGRLNKEEASLLMSDLFRSYVNTDFFKHVSVLTSHPNSFDWEKLLDLFKEQRKAEPIKVSADEAISKV